jgi:dTDP-glucose pyrophosphorylase
MARLLLPSAGRALRFTGILKELLPIDGSGITLLENAAITGMVHFNIDEIAVVTTAFKEPYHRSILDKSAVSQAPIHYIRQTGIELWGALKDAIDPTQDSVLLLPDTVLRLQAGRVKITSDFMLGLFFTEEPERFSTVADGKIYTKVGIGSMAWGAAYFSAEVGRKRRRI